MYKMFDLYVSKNDVLAECLAHKVTTMLLAYYYGLYKYSYLYKTLLTNEMFQLYMACLE